jgi:hypothetical protein
MASDLLSKGQMVKFSSERQRYRVRSANDRFAVCTKPFNVHGPDAVIYTIVDFDRNVRGRENLIFCMGFNTDEKCDAALSRLSSGESEVSYRHYGPLDIEQVS